MKWFFSVNLNEHVLPSEMRRHTYRHPTPREGGDNLKGVVSYRAHLCVASKWIVWNPPWQFLKNYC